MIKVSLPQLSGQVMGSSTRICIINLIFCFSLSCFSIAKKIEGVEPPPVNVNLDSDLYILYGRRKEKSANGSLLPHEDKPTISAKKYNPVKSKSSGKGDNFPKLPLVRAHGVLMLIAWPLLGVSGIFFALWMQPALPKGQWFQVSTHCDDSIA